MTDLDFRPMRAADAPEDLSTLPYPLLVSPKFDGIRAARWRDRLITRRGEPVPNRHVTQVLIDACPEGVEGELLLFSLYLRHREVASAIMSRDGTPPFVFAVFDCWSWPRLPFSERLKDLENMLGGGQHRSVWVVPHSLVHSPEDLARSFHAATEAGAEGLILRDPDGLYVRDRCHRTRGPVWKLKGTRDDEAEVVGFEEEVSVDGHPKGRLGALYCRFPDEPELVWKVGSGFSGYEREEMWPGELMIGKVVTVQHQPGPGGRQRGERPRFPVFLHVRED